MLKGPLLDRLVHLSARAEELERLLADPEVLANQARYRELAKEHRLASRAASHHRHLLALQQRRAEAEAILADGTDAELAKLADEEVEQVKADEAQLEREIESLLLQQDEDAERDVIMEIRAGTGGEEAALFAADLFRMYVRYAEDRGWKVEVISSHETERGGFREVVFEVKGQNVYRDLQFESGGHRVQRVPVTESSGRIHTSAATVAVLPAAEDVDVPVNQQDLRIDRFCASGPGGQHVNKTASAIRITHIPTGIVVSSQDERSQHKNLAKAMRVLRSRLYEAQQAEQKRARDQARRTQIGSGDRSDRVRTYNFPQNRVTDHRLNQNYPLDRVIAGDIHRIIAELAAAHREEQITQLAHQGSTDG